MAGIDNDVDIIMKKLGGVIRDLAIDLFGQNVRISQLESENETLKKRIAALSEQLDKKYSEPDKECGF